MPNRFDKYDEPADAPTGNRFDKYDQLDYGQTALAGVHPAPVPVSAPAPVPKHKQRPRAELRAAPPERQTSFGQTMLESFENVYRGASQGTNPHTHYMGPQRKPLRKPIGIAIEHSSDYPVGDPRPYYRYGSGEDQYGVVDPSKHVMLRDTNTGQVVVYERDPQFDESGVAGAARMISLGLGAGPLPNLSRGASLATRATKAAEDAAAFNRLGVRRFGPAFSSGPVAAIGKQLTEYPFIGAPVRNALDESLTGARDAATRVAEQFGPARPYDQTGYVLQRGLDRYHSAGIRDLEPGVLEGMGINPRAPMKPEDVMSGHAAARAAKAAPIREAEGGGKAITSRGVEVPMARTQNQTLTARRGAEDMSVEELDKIIRAPSSETSFAARAEALYERAHHHLPTQFRKDLSANPQEIRAVNTKNAFGAIIDQEARAGISGGIVEGRLGGMAERVKTNVTLPTLRAMRTEVGRLLSNFGQYDARLDRTQLKQIYGALSRDIEISYQDLANRAYIATREKGAARVASDVATDADSALFAFRRADRYYRMGIERMDNFLKVAGADRPEYAASTLAHAALNGGRGDIKMLRTARAALKPEEWNDFAGLVVRRLGEPNASATGITEEIGFSVSTFMRRWNEMTPQARSVLFSGEHAKAVDDLVRVSRRLANVEALANKSRTLSNAAGVGTLLAGGGAYGAGLASLETLLLGLAAGGTASILLSRPSYVRWVTTYARLANRPAEVTAMSNHVNRLASMAANDPALEPVLEALEPALEETRAQLRKIKGNGR